MHPCSAMQCSALAVCLCVSANEASCSSTTDAIALHCNVQSSLRKLIPFGNRVLVKRIEAAAKVCTRAQVHMHFDGNATTMTGRA